MKQVGLVKVTVILVTAGETDDPLGLYAWRAIREAASLYQAPDGWIDLRIAGAEDRRVVPSIDVRYLGRGPMQGTPSALPAHTLDELLATSVWTSRGEASISGVGSPVMDQRALVAFTRELLGISSGTVVVVHDRPIHPPSQWRYIIWDYVPGGVTMSCAPMDPLFWGDRVDEETRLATLGSRLRAALCLVLGSAIGLHRCNNPTCFLYANVDRVSRLDLMVRIGDEHGASSLVGLGFGPALAGPDFLAEVVRIEDSDQA